MWTHHCESPVTKDDLSAAQRRLLALLQRINFGRIRGLTIRGGQPVFQPPPRVEVDHKFGGHNGPRPEIDLEDFVLKRHYRELFRDLAAIGDGQVANLEVRGGLPQLMTTEEAAAS
jgi:hypothetical protein